MQRGLLASRILVVKRGDHLLSFLRIDLAKDGVEFFFFAGVTSPE